MMRIVLSGYGKMGKMIEAAALARNHVIAAKVDPFDTGADFRTLKDALVSAKQSAGAAAASPVDLIIDFSHPDGAVGNMLAACEAGIPLVMGTTGWLDKINEIRAAAEKAKIAIVYGSNYSAGIHIFYKIVSEAARLMNDFDEYDIAGFEIHHNQKVDSPSGTARSIADIVLSKVARKKRLVTDAFSRRPEPDEFHMASLRVGAVPGTHTLVMDSSADSIELTHTARNRESLARGAVWAAEWLAANPGRRGLIEVDEVFAGL